MQHHVYLHYAPDDPLVRAIGELSLTLKLCLLKGSAMPIDPAVQAEFDKITADITAEKTVDGSAVTLLNGLNAKIAALVAQATQTNASPDLIAAIEALHTGITANTATLAAGVTANTPAAGS